MKLKEISLLVLIVIIGFVSCKKDDDNETIPVVEIRDRAEQQEADIDSLQKYLKMHYYNAEEIATIDNPRISDLDIVKIEDGEAIPEGYAKLKEAVDSISLTYRETNYKLYIFKLNKGAGESPKFSDKVRVIYEGFTLDDEVFDSAVNPIDIDLVGDGVNTGGTIRGWQVAFPEFKTAESFMENEDGTVTYVNQGAGMMFIPSGLAYFSDSKSGISAYSPLIFKFELLQTTENDHDNDGVPTHLEDRNGNGELITAEGLADDDTDEDGIPDYIDTDDDGDGVLTINEDLEDTDLEVDSDGDGDPTNDKNGDGNPINDDTDGDDIPNYLDADNYESN